MAAAEHALRLTLVQQAAVARAAYALEKARGLVLLCGPAGVGKTTVLAHIAQAKHLQTRSISQSRFAELFEQSITQPVGWLPADILLVDDAHLAADGNVSALIENCRRRHPTTSIVLAGEGRLLSLASRDNRLEQLMPLRATLPPFSLDDSKLLVAASIAAAGSSDDRDAVACRIHEIAAGIPAVVIRLAELAAMLTAADSHHVLVPDDIETIHRRLSLAAA